MRHVAIVPARAGSKGVPGKNLKSIGGQTLTHRALSIAKASGIFDQVILTTDIPLFLDERPDGWVTHPRPASLAQDDSPMADVVLDVLQSRDIKDHVFIWLLQPTSPFRRVEHFREIVQLLELKSPSSVIGVTQVGDSHPSRMYKLSFTHKDLIPFLPKVSSFDNRQDLKPAYERNGMYYVARCREFKEKKTFFIPACKPYLVDRMYAFNINDELDFRLAQEVAKWM